MYSYFRLNSYRNCSSEMSQQQQALAELGWRTFNFFNLEPVQDPADPTKKATILQGINILCWTPSNVDGNASVLFGETNGAIFQMDRRLDVRFFKAFKRQLIHFALAGTLLVAVGDDSDSGLMKPSSSSPTLTGGQQTAAATAVPTLKLWDLSQWGDAVAPKCRLSFPLNLGRKVDVSKVYAVALSEQQNTLVVGLSNTSLFYAFGDLQKERSAPKFRSLRDGANTLGQGQLAGIAVGQMRDRTIVCCVSDRTLNSYILGPDGNVLQTVVHDAKGCENNCWHFSPLTNQLVVADRDMVHFYNLADCLEMGGENGRCHALGRGSEKVQLIELDGLVALLTEKEAQIQSTSTQSSRMSMLHIYDVEKRYIAFFCSMPSPCRLFLLDDDIYLLNAAGELNRLVEQSLAAKLDILLRKNLFDLAISIIRRDRHSTEEQCNGIYMKYGDYLYKKGDFDNAIKQYVETIGHVEPSNIIKKFLDGPRIAQLCYYLETLHNRGVAIGQHTTLLLSAYVKLNDGQKLNQFIDQGERHLAREGFDADAAIKLLRSAQLFRVAAKLALKCQKPEMFLDILCQDTKEWANALRFIEKLPPSKACQFLELYGPGLLENLEQETLKLIRQVIVSKEANLKQLVKMLMSRPKRMEELFNELNMAGELQEPQLRTTLLEQRLKQLQNVEKPTKEQLDEIFQLLGPDNFEQALLLEQRYKCAPMVVHILRSQNKKEELVRYLLREGDILEAIEMCGERALRDMWIDLISYMSARPSETRRADLLALLKRVSQSDLLHPLVVLELLSHDESLQVGDVREFVAGWLERQNAAIKSNESKLAEQQRRLEEMNAAIEDLENNDQIFQVSKCTVCNNPLQVPAVHFLCRHSYHANCFESYSGNSPDQCPACVVAARKSKSTTTAADGQEGAAAGEQQQERKQQRQQFTHQQFRNELADSTDAMSLISDYIAKGAFDSITTSSTTSSSSGGKPPAESAGGSGAASKSKKPQPQSNNPFEEDDEEEGREGTE